jgi:adenylate cyclase
VRVRRCFAFLDLSGFSAYTDQHGDDEAVLVLAALRTTLRSAAERRGVRITKWLGDGAMLSGVDAAAVIDCALATRDRVAETCPLPLRGGIAQGDVIMFEGDDYVGAAVNAAARLCDMALPGQLLCAAVADDAPSWVAVDPVGPMAISGLTRPVQVAEVRLADGAARAERAAW